MIHILHILPDYCFLLGKTVLGAIYIIAIYLTCLLCFVRSLYINLIYMSNGGSGVKILETHVEPRTTANLT